MAIEDIVIDRTSAQLIKAIDTVRDEVGTESTALGVGTNGAVASGDGSVAVGSSAYSESDNSVSVGAYASADAENAIAIGSDATATKVGAIQIGNGDNNTANTVKIKNTMILDTNGRIPFSALQGGEVVGLSVNASNHLIVTYANGTTADLGTIGGGGTGDYDDLTNQPKVNNNTLIGNKTSAQLGLQSELVSGTNIKTINGESVLGSGNIDVPVYSYEVEVEFNQSGDIFLQQSDIDYLYANKPQTVIANIIQGGTLAARQILTLIGKNDVVGIKNGLLNYLIINDIDEFENKFDFIQIPTVSSNKLIIREAIYQEKLTFDSIPTAGSNNPVTSGGVKTYVDTAVGDINTALQDLHTAFQGLISGGGAQ